MTARSPRILFLDQFGGLGGGQRVLLALVRAAIAEFGSASVMAPSGPLEEVMLKEFGDRIVYVRCEEPAFGHGTKTVADVWRLASYGLRFRKHIALLGQHDIVYVNGLRHLPHLLFQYKAGCRFIYHVHLNHSTPEKFLLFIVSRLASTFSIVLASSFIAERLGAVRKTALIENALDQAFAGLHFTDRFSVPQLARAAVIGTLRPEKGQDIAIAAVENMELHLIGPVGEGAVDWANRIKEHAGKNVHFAGPSKDVARDIDALGIQFNLVPSRWEEPFGLAAIEGMACSCLTIVSGSGGLAEIARKTGAVIAQDAQALRTVLMQMIGMPPTELRALAKRQYEATQIAYSPDLFAKRIRALLRAALAS